MADIRKIDVRLSGLRPIMFDRYAGDNKTQLSTEDRMYLDDKQRLVVPAINLFSLLCAENTKSVARIGPKNEAAARREVAMGIAGYVSIDPFDVPLIGPDGKQIVWAGKWTKQIYVHEAVARVKGGIPNPKVRPTVAMPWHLDFTVEYVDNEGCSLGNLKQVLTVGGSIGLGTFRPFFGRYALTKFEERA